MHRKISQNSSVDTAISSKDNEKQKLRSLFTNIHATFIFRPETKPEAYVNNDLPEIFY